MDHDRAIEIDPVDCYRILGANGVEHAPIILDHDGVLHLPVNDGAQRLGHELLRLHLVVPVDEHAFAKSHLAGSDAAGASSEHPLHGCGRPERPRLDRARHGIWIGYTDVDSSGRGARDGLATPMRTVPGGAQETGGPYMRDPRHPRHFTDDFKRQIVDLHSAGKPKREAMDEYDLGKSTVERRVESINATGSPRAADNRTPGQDRILELERENRRLC